MKHWKEIILALAAYIPLFIGIESALTERYGGSGAEGLEAYGIIVTIPIAYIVALLIKNEFKKTFSITLFSYLVGIPFIILMLLVVGAILLFTPV